MSAAATASRGAAPVSIRRFRPDEWPMYREVRLQALADSPDAFGSTLEREQSYADATWAERLQAAAHSKRDLALLAEQEGHAVGLAWLRIDADDTAATLYQMWVAPGWRRRGTGRRLLETALAWAQVGGLAQITLRVACGNTAAQRLYRRAGFQAAGRPEPLRPGAALSQCMRLVLDEAARAARIAPP